MITLQPDFILSGHMKPLEHMKRTGKPRIRRNLLSGSYCCFSIDPNAIGIGKTPYEAYSAWIDNLTGHDRPAILTGQTP